MNPMLFILIVILSGIIGLSLTCSGSVIVLTSSFREGKKIFITGVLLVSYAFNMLFCQPHYIAATGIRLAHGQWVQG